MVYNRVELTTQGVGFAFADTQQAIYWHGRRIPLSEIKMAGLTAPERHSLSAMQLGGVILLVASGVFCGLWKFMGIPVATAGAIAGGLAVLILLIGGMLSLLSRFVPHPNAGLRKFVVVRRNGRRLSFNPYGTRWTPAVRDFYIPCAGETEAVMGLLGSTMYKTHA